MRQFSIAIAVLTTTALFAAAPVSAERIQGGPLTQNGKCWVKHSDTKDSTWGIWGDCPKPAAAPANFRTNRRRI